MEYIGRIFPVSWSSSCCLSDNKLPDVPAVPGYGDTAHAVDVPT